MRLHSSLKRSLLGAVGAAALCALAAPALAGPDNNSLIVGVGTDLVVADPANSTLGTDIPILYAMYDRLMDITPSDLTPRPMLATEWSWSDDKKTLTLKLREGVTFHDGAKFDAAAVKKSLEYFKESGTNKDLDDVVGIEVTGPYEIALTSKQVNSSLPGLLAERAGMILSPLGIDTFGKEGYAKNPVGTGPFKFARHDAGAAVFFEKFADYWDKDAIALDSIEFRVIKNPTSALSAIMTGQIDYLGSVDPVNMPAMERNPNVRAAVEPTIGFGIININTGLKPLDNKLARQALAMSIDRDEMAKAVYGSIPTKGTVLPVPQDYWPSTPSIQESFKYDPARAKQLLAEAGFPDGMKLPFCVNANSGMPQPALKVLDIMTEQMKPAGITLEVNQQPSSAGCIDLFATQKVMPAFLVTWSGRPDPAITYNQMLATNSYYNTSRIVYGDADAVLAELQATFDQETQDKIYDRLNALYLEYVPMVSLYSFVNVVAYKKGLVGEEPNLLGRPYVRNLRWEK